MVECALESSEMLVALSGLDCPGTHGLLKNTLRLFGEHASLLISVEQHFYRGQWGHLILSNDFS